MCVCLCVCVCMFVVCACVCETARMHTELQAVSALQSE